MSIGTPTSGLANADIETDRHERDAQPLARRADAVCNSDTAIYRVQLYLACHRTALTSVQSRRHRYRRDYVRQRRAQTLRPLRFDPAYPL